MNTPSLVSLPQFVKEWINQPKVKSSATNTVNNFDPAILNGVGEGQRNSAAASYAGKLLSTFAKEEWDTTVWKILSDWNQKNKPPLPDQELRATFESIKSREVKQQEEENEKSQSIALKLVEEIKKERIVFFHNEQKEGYAAITGDGREVYKLRSRMFRQYITHYIYKQVGKIISQDVVNNIIQALEGRAIFEGQQYELFTRIIFKDNAIWYDLGEGLTAHIDKDGWSISEVPPILFKRFHHQLPQVIPQPGGEVSDICEFINLQTAEEKLLFQIYTVASFIPGFPHPLLVLYGAQGAGKTTPLRLLKSLVDPSLLKTLTAPDSLREFVQLASHHYLFFLDNLSSITDWLSDALARACTGDGFSKRELFTDDDDIIYSFQRVVALNGINLVVQKADLLDRSILLGLERISKEKRREEQEFWREFDNKKPFLLGAIFTAVSKALAIYPNVHLTTHPRMADYCRWGCAIAEALGYRQEDFLDAYYSNINRQNEEAIEASPVGTAITHFIEDQYNNFWEGTPSELLTHLEKQAEVLKINTKSHTWPKDPAWLTRRIQLIQANLNEQGITVVRDDKARPRRLIIQKKQEDPVDTDIVSNDIQNEANNTPTVDGRQSASQDGYADNTVEATSTVPTEPSEVTTNTSVWDQFIPKKPVVEYDDEQLEVTLQTINDYIVDSTFSIPNKEKYLLIKQEIEQEQEKRKGQVQL